MIEADDFAINNTTNYLNNAAFGPVPESILNDTHAYLQEYSHNGPDSPFVKKEAYFEETRNAVAGLIGCSPEEVIFTQSITHGINIIAEGYSWKENDRIILRESSKEHVANFLPWLKIAKEKNLDLQITGSDEFGNPDLQKIELLMKEKPGGIVAIAHALYNLGTVLDVESIALLAKKYSYTVLVDAAQTVGCLPVNVKALGCDYMVFSGYKWLCAPPGIGILYISKETQKLINYYGMDVRILEAISDGVQVKLNFSNDDYTVKPGPYKFENGFRNYTGVVGLLKAIELLNRVGISEVAKKNKELIALTIQLLNDIPGVSILGVNDLAKRTSIVSFKIEGKKPSEIVAKLHNYRIVLAAREIGDESILRISPHYYNTKEQIESCVNLIKEIIKQ